ncbi:GNAT family N-acetyltransferase [Clostridium sardiniense]|uniref:GNAT family N-acetyltransferase n=1 Tax=Clostridium sardiniense TaxID=29369 RepID=A0ABS7KYQ2_CLOSR|nr:GNAT family N-acetyltransferase [Clostridium sardiniense]MBY0755950.1 GNAT family N-acetyltransferase [Clostridium sardiniense]MDQ0460760.1 ElaA protein [Clostridium sardiniense]
MRLCIEKFDELTRDDLYRIMQERFEVFACEQKITCENEFDGKDKDCIHIYAKDGDKIAAYLRILPKGIGYEDTPGIGRVLVKKEYRGYGLGRVVLRAAIKYIKENFDDKKIKLSSQAYIKSLYESVGFSVVSDEYEEAGIPHVKMIYDI